MRSLIAVVVVAVGCPAAALWAPQTAWADDDFVALAVSVGSGRAAGWATANSQDQANQLALAHCTAEAGDACEVVAGTRNGCVGGLRPRLRAVPGRLGPRCGQRRLRRPGQAGSAERADQSHALLVVTASRRAPRRRHPEFVYRFNKSS
ncbi:hypothetical protein ACYJ3J_01180 [Mycobacterium avium subsp. paratuberculosis]|uniref:hypothetical protein n=1 Tax=Mycobacterium avium TaxID=1764 RepID=UPI000323CF70|nr:hypothetical protein [Mycobacterium avium]UKO60639.1 hypothetical protein KYH25_05225 [Mycobacterium avium subsp. paratuberculosis]UKO64937.1 hypothetical protein KYF43_05225 [Mycobacterium avium subsp. paratuberculosis]UKO69242.1 hypothetical protein KYG56_05220 [Mycobacterium avium subsp. paratuberculosis]UKO73532.1 hypothetical protein KYG70_05220 [Mycobacterium avium subsp. paratuberculosis]UYB85015.1 hypothetical protein OBK31_14495 [Mycobacterium avium subsp. paratuberculosis K-10]